MIPAGVVLDQLYEDNDAITPDQQAKVLRRLNLAYLDIAAMASWVGMRRSTSVSFVSATDRLLPADMLGVDAVYRPASSTSYFTVYQPRERWALNDNLDRCRRYCFTGTVSQPVVWAATGATVQKGQSSVSGLPSGYSGEYVSFAKRLGVYKLTTDSTLDVTFMDDSVQGGGYSIRPAGTRYAQLFDENADGVTDTVTLDYWAMPQPITDQSQFILLPQSDVLLMAVLVRSIGIRNIDEQRADRYRREYADALARAKSLNPIYATPQTPTNNYGMNAGWGAGGG